MGRAARAQVEASYNWDTNIARVDALLDLDRTSTCYGGDMLLTETRTAPRDMVKTLAILMAVLAPFIIYAGTAQSIVSIWNSSETFAHGYIILPISLWLIWQRREVLARMSPTPYWPALLSLAVCGFGWLLAEMGDVQVVRQYAFAAMLPLTRWS